MWIVNMLKRDWSKIARTVEASSQDLVSILEERLSGLSIGRNAIIEAFTKTKLNPDKPTAWNEDDLVYFVDNLRKIAKPMLIAANKIDLPYGEENVKRLKELGYLVVPCCAEAELALRRAAEKGLIDYTPGDCNFKILHPEKLIEPQKKALETIREKILLKYGSTGVQEAINLTFFKLLNMIVVYPVEDIERLTDHKGNVLPDAYLVPYGTTAKEFAYKIHSELGESFIYAVEVRNKKRIGENYILKNRDVISIVSAKKRT